jgi:hypothetical protein
MHKKLFRIFIALATSIILLGHTFVPHHHEEQHSHNHEHHHHEQGGLKDLFTHHCHSTDCFTSVHRHEVNQPAHQQVPGTLVYESYFICDKGFFKPEQYIYKCDYVYISPHLINLDFRGPPSSLFNC